MSKLDQALLDLSERESLKRRFKKAQPIGLSYSVFFLQTITVAANVALILQATGALVSQHHLSIFDITVYSSFFIVDFCVVFL